MSDKIKPSPDWEDNAVVERLRKATKPGQPSAAQIFLNDEIPASELPEKAREIVTDTSTRLNLPDGAIKLGKVFRNARSFSVSTDVPDVFLALAKRDEVKSILESEQSDIMPKPRNMKDV